jgi:hypothetical protein
MKNAMNTRPWTTFTSILTALAATLLVATARGQTTDPWQDFQARPILLGTSGGNINDISRRFCCSGTLGALVTDGHDRFILSNNHILALANLGSPGDPVSQPGMIDQNCHQDGIVANLTSFIPLQFRVKKDRPLNLADAAIAKIITGEVDRDGAILGVGMLDPTPIAPSLGLAVCKSGRTTRYTTGEITTVNLNVSVGYSSSCGGPTTSVAYFTDQIGITGDSGGFSAGGDSGSLIVATGSSQPVGLLFAGGGRTTIANPIGPVLSGLGVHFIGGKPFTGFAATGGAIAQANKVQGRNSERLFRTPGVHAHGIGLSKNGEPVIRIFVKASDAATAKARIPAKLEGIPVEFEISEPFVAF